MTMRVRQAIWLVLFALLLSPAGVRAEEAWRSTRIADPAEHAGPFKGYAYRDQAERVMRELDLAPGDAVVDIGAGAGFWTERMARAVGGEGVVYATEIDERKVAWLAKAFEHAPQVKAVLSPLDGTGLAADSCDLAFLSQVYHHLPDDRQAYLAHLRQVIKPSGRLAIIEKYPAVAGDDGHGTQISELVAATEQAGWIPLRIELIPGTGHFLAIFAQRDVFQAKPPSE